MACSAHGCHRNAIRQCCSSTQRPVQLQCQEEGGRLTGLHFFYVEEYLRLMAPGLDLVAAVASSEAFTKWCCAKHDFCDEHLLWLAVRWSGYDPGNPVTNYSLRPVHGVHIKRREPLHPGDKIEFCQFFQDEFRRKYLWGVAQKHIEATVDWLCRDPATRPSNPTRHQAIFGMFSSWVVVTACLRALVCRLQRKLKKENTSILKEHLRDVPIRISSHASARSSDGVFRDPTQKYPTVQTASRTD